MHKNVRAAAFATLMSLLAFANMAHAAFLADRHTARGIECKACHVTESDKVPNSACLKCHGGSYAKLAEKTDNGDINWHESHLGEPPCSDCHKGHKPSVLVCQQCHEDFKVKVP